MVTVGDLYNYINEIAPFKSAMDFDNVGLLIGDKNKVISKIMLSLDATPSVVNEAYQKNVDLIITHHPVIFKAIKTVLQNSIPYMLIEKGISVISAHTNLDMANGGVNDCLADVIGLKNKTPLEFYNELPCALIGDLNQPLSPLEFAKIVKNRLNCDGLRYVSGNRQVSKVALCSGAGGDFIFKAIQSGADAFLTGEIKHHEILAANDAGITLVDAGHFKTENIVIDSLAKKLKTKFQEIQILISEEMTDGIKFI